MRVCSSTGRAVQNSSAGSAHSPGPTSSRSRCHSSRNSASGSFMALPASAAGRRGGGRGRRGGGGGGGGGSGAGRVGGAAGVEGVDEARQWRPVFVAPADEQRPGVLPGARLAALVAFLDAGQGTPR